MHPFSIPWKHKKTEVFWCFQEVEKGCIGKKWVKRFRNETFLQSCYWLIVTHQRKLRAATCLFSIIDQNVSFYTITRAPRLLIRALSVWAIPSIGQSSFLAYFSPINLSNAQDFIDFFIKYNYESLKCNKLRPLWPTTSGESLPSNGMKTRGFKKSSGFYIKQNCKVKIG